MNKGFVRYIIGVLAVIIVIVLLVLGFNLLRNLLNSNSDDRNADSSQQDKPDSLFSEERRNQPVQYTVNGAVVGDEERRAIRIYVSPSERRIDIIRGYNGEVIKSETTANNQEAYDAFIKAINGAGFTTRFDEKGRGDEGQSCQLGRRFNYEINPGNNDAFYTWSSTCGAKQGTFGGNATLVRNLFQAQIPNYQDVTRGTELR